MDFHECKSSQINNFSRYEVNRLDEILSYSYNLKIGHRKKGNLNREISIKRLLLSRLIE